MSQSNSWAIGDGTKVHAPAGALHVDRFNPAGQRTGYRHVGNCTDFKITPSEEVIEVNDAVDASRGIIARIPKSRRIEISGVLQEVTQDNMALFFAGDVWNYTQAATAVVGETIAATAPGVTLGRSYQVAKTPVNPTPAVVVKEGGVTKTVNTDYIFDYTTGLLYIPPTSGITPGVLTLTIDYTPIAVVGGSPQRRVSIGTAVSPIIGIRFNGDVASGPAIDAEIWRCQISPDGDFNFISDDVVSFPFKGLILKDPIHALDAVPTPYGYTKIR